MTTPVVPEAEIFGARLKELREKRGETVRSLATLTETSFTYISDMEHGRKVPSLSMLLRLAAALDCKVTDLVKSTTCARSFASGGSAV
jgi:transcriptional regulator with XRE-family HTH domain